MVLGYQSHGGRVLSVPGANLVESNIVYSGDQIRLGVDITKYIWIFQGCGPLLPTCLPTFLSTLTDQSECLGVKRFHYAHRNHVHSEPQGLEETPPFSYSSVASQSGEGPGYGAPSTPQSPQSAVSSYTVTAAISSANQCPFEKMNISTASERVSSVVHRQGHINTVYTQGPTTENRTNDPSLGSYKEMYTISYANRAIISRM
ncbi:hypothetical protein MG293_005818 [Ovis ammon polii]|uniref:Uncharacterized protein n=1 Tax=Ovis ammon polii TaxID=230172 RepID=A0AAD4UFH5_OVIAM|nr:hypothetical protein MG293_005818 [Ovis ammon polii]